MKLAWIATAAWLALSGPCLAQTVSSTPSPGATSLIVTGQHVLFGAHTTGTQTGALLLFDSTVEPPDGTVSPKGCFTVDPSGRPLATTGMANTPAAVPFLTGIVVVFSTGADCFHKVASVTYISMLWQ